MPLEAINKELSRHESNSKQAIMSLIQQIQDGAQQTAFFLGIPVSLREYISDYTLIKTVLDNLATSCEELTHWKRP